MNLRVAGGESSRLSRMRSARHTSPCPNPLPRCEALSLNLSNARALFLRQGGGLLIEGGDVQLTNCNIHSNGAFLAGEMVLRGRFSCLWPPPRWPHPLPSPCTCAPVQTEELASGLGGGLSIHGGDVTLTGCNIFSNGAMDAGVNRVSLGRVSLNLPNASAIPPSGRWPTHRHDR